MGLFWKNFTQRRDVREERKDKKKGINLATVTSRLSKRGFV